MKIYNYQASFDLFLKDLHEIVEFIEPVDENKLTYSHRIYSLLLRVCTDFESLCKDLLVEANCKKPVKDMKIIDYKTLDATIHLEPVVVEFLLWRPIPLVLEPFKNWTTSEPPLSWYKAYNTVKHNRNTEFSKACLFILVEAIAGQFSLISKVSNFNWGEICSWSTDNGTGNSEFYRSPFRMNYPKNG